KALRAQINPHFIYNSLNSVQLLIADNRRVDALNYTSRFSRLMRRAFEQSVSPMIPLEDELETLRLYLEIEGLRFSGKFDYRIEIDETVNTNQVEIPTMLLQPIVENSIWHGLMHKATPGTLHIRIRDMGKAVHCEIEDDGVGREAAKQHQSGYLKDKSTSGLKVTQQRIENLNRLYNRKLALKIIDLYNQAGDAAGTKVVLQIPSV
ncbi:MAG: histidine kinase, partial [Bacteroidota bacterium]